MGTTASQSRFPDAQLTVCHTDAGKATATGTRGQRQEGGRATFQTLLQEQEDPAGGGAQGTGRTGWSLSTDCSVTLQTPPQHRELRRPTLP